MTAQIIYLTHPVTRELIGQSLADPDPLEKGNWLIPAHAYADTPPTTGEGETVVRESDGWVVIPDHRGTVYRTDNGQPQEHLELGALPAGLTTEAPPGPAYTWTDESWQLDPEREQELLSQAITELCLLIDTAADKARAAAAGDPLRAVEYQRAADEARAYQAAGFPEDDVPRNVAAWAIQGRTPKQAALHILDEAQQFDAALYQIREIRLNAKEQVRDLIAAGNKPQALEEAQNAVALIWDAVAGVGNAEAV